MSLTLADLVAALRASGVRAVTLHLASDGTPPAPPAPPLVAIPANPLDVPPAPPPVDEGDADRFAAGGFEPVPRRRA